MIQIRLTDHFIMLHGVRLLWLCLGAAGILMGAFFLLFLFCLMRVGAEADAYYLDVVCHQETHIDKVVNQLHREMVLGMTA